ncbi:MULTISPECIES: hypothetical protein [Streptomyces]|uniref:Uncharacterized protein n=1 Tax=Streptomyces fradiae ATCC 10745 = DSM 40063 TaxID=1319510 RepID=A0A1Y2P3I8_STRFR|nr:MULTISPECIES: hypothetical protein [Streptomyces]KAF0648734.1 hypothetical protein K701_17230 [Streptomyces fradiae ATCC 10745 = DSM 40063]OSY53787.1 hypothetical protein BG846_00544 [Streptomyces fradiae ATCC 10745 = DSM 40063]QEV16107.1 hypothetical protein CP974_28595 [Streptomyces fradiae ATCC 10745 = DSM 40063]
MTGTTGTTGAAGTPGAPAAAGPLRPAFHEGQVLSAADLTAAVGHARGLAARHARHQHDWGVAEGLGLTAEPRTDPLTGARAVEVTVAPGVAVDGTGREIVLTAPAVLRESDFDEVNGADPPTDEPYPVFLTAADRTPPAAPAPLSCAPGATATRVEETYRLLFGRLGDERLAAEQRPPAVGAPPADPPARWLVLLGYVRWTDGHFTAVSTEARGVGVRFTGVRADTVAARSGALALRTRPEPEEGEPALVLSGGEQPSLVFGLYRGSGAVAPLMTVAANGNLTVEGSLSGRLQAGSTLVASGTATDGMLLPLPEGVAPEQVADGRVALHVLLTPRTPALPTDSTLASPVEAGVDGDRRVRCRTRLHDPLAAPAEVAERPCAVDYIVVAAVAAVASTNGGG